MQSERNHIFEHDGNVTDATAFGLIGKSPLIVLIVELIILYHMLRKELISNNGYANSHIYQIDLDNIKN